MSKVCIVCNKRAYSDYCVQHKPRKPIAKRGKRTIEYEHWRDTVAKPHLDSTTGRICQVLGCNVTEYLEVDHIATRGSRADLKMNTGNVRYLCHPHHREITDGARLAMK